MEILYSDNDIVVCVKPVGYLSERDNNKQSVPKLITDTLGIKEVFSVHRLDKNVGGIMVYALNSNAASILIRDIADKKIKKEYLALVCGAEDLTSGSMSDLLYHDMRTNKTYVVQRQRKGVRDALLDYSRVISKDGISLVRIRLHTGRTHQIRVQFSSRKMPLVGDGRYGSRDGSDKPQLYSFRLSFDHPISRKPLDFVSYPDFSKYGFDDDDVRSSENFRFS